MIRRSALHAIVLVCLASGVALAQPLTLTVDAAASGKAITRDLWGAFFEDPSYAAAKLPDHFAFSTVRDSASGDLILKLVNGVASPRPLRIELRGLPRLPSEAIRIVFTSADADLANEDARPPVARPETTRVPVSSDFVYEVPANSLSLFRIPSHS